MLYDYLKKKVFKISSKKTSITKTGIKIINMTVALHIITSVRKTYFLKYLPNEFY